MKKKKTRDSNFELLRIFAMVLIVFHHIIVHVVYNQLSSNYIYIPGQMFNNFVFYKRLIILEYGALAGKIGNGLFILLTGYFLCSSKSFKIDNKIKKLIGYGLFGTLVLFFLSICYGYFIENNIYKIETINSFNNKWWFLGYYLLIIIIGRFVLNKFLNKLKKEEYTTLLIVMFALISFSFSRNILNGFIAGFDILFAGLFYYCLGGYINKYKLFKNLKMKQLFICLCILLILAALNYRSLVLKDIYEKLGNGINYYYQLNVWSSECDIFTISISILLFGIFSKMKIDNNKIINYVSSSTLLIYVIHDCDFSWFLMSKINFVYLLHDNMAMFYIDAALLISFIFMIGIVINIIYNLLIKYLKNKITI